jgi:hypothetical protein
MLPLSLVLVLTSALARDLAPEELIRRLSSPDRVVREEAARTLEERGAQALPALRAARESASVQEARGRLGDLIDRIESGALDRPTLVALEVDDQPLGEAVRALAARSSFSLSLDDLALASRRVTVRSSSPLPFWEAVDRLGRAGHVRRDPGPRGDVGNDARASMIHLVGGDPPTFTAYHGPLVIHLFATHWHQDVSFEAAGVATNVPRRNAVVTIEVQAFAEPGRFINSNGLPRLEAIDERDRALSPNPGTAIEQPNPSEHSWLIPGRISLLQWHVPLALPELPARSPLKLRGMLPVVISSRKPAPLVIPLVDAAGKTFRQGPFVVRIEKVSTSNANTTEVDLLLSEDVGPPERTRIALGPEMDYVGDYLANRIEFEDAEGHPLNWLFLGNHPTSTESGELRVQTYVAGVAPPARLSVYGLHRVATEIPFKFGDVPSP